MGSSLKITWQLILKGIWVRVWGSMAPGRARVRVPLAGLGKGILNWVDEVRLGKFHLSFKNKYCHNVLLFSQGPLKFSCALSRESKSDFNKHNKIK